MGQHCDGFVRSCLLAANLPSLPRPDSFFFGMFLGGFALFNIRTSLLLRGLTSGHGTIVPTVVRNQWCQHLFDEITLRSLVDLVRFCMRSNRAKMFRISNKRGCETGIGSTFSYLDKPEIKPAFEFQLATCSVVCSSFGWTCVKSRVRCTHQFQFASKSRTLNSVALSWLDNGCQRSRPARLATRNGLRWRGKGKSRHPGGVRGTQPKALSWTSASCDKTPCGP